MTVLCYHAVQPGWQAPMSMEPDMFASHMGWLARHRRVVPLETAVGSLDRHGRLPGRAVALTFDDGFRSVHQHALEVLTRHGLPVTVFLVAATLGEGGHDVDWVDRPPDSPLETLTVDQIHEMQSLGVSFQSHSLAHRDLTQLSYDECVRDLTSSRELLESVLDSHVRLLAYPRGRHSAAVRAAAEAAGYTHAFTLPEGREPSGPYALPRVGIYHDNSVSRLRMKSNRSYVPLRTSPMATRLGRALAGARHG